MESKLSRQEETHNKHSSKHDEDDICAAAESKQISHLAESKDIVMSKFNSPVSRRRSESADAKLLEIEQEEALAADAEFEALKNVPTEVVPEVANTQEAKNFVNGFRMYSIIIYSVIVTLTSTTRFEQNFHEHERCRHWRRVVAFC